MKKLSYYENYVFFESLYELTKSGIPLLKSMDIVNTKNKSMVEEVKNQLNNGELLSKALSDTGLFSDTALSIIKTGEWTGNFDLCFEKLYKYYERMTETRKNIITSLFYPAILVFSIFFLLFFINFYFIPQISSLYDMNKNTSAFVSLMFSVSSFSNKYKLESIIFFLSLFILIYLITSEFFSDKNRLVYVPILSSLIKDYAVSNIIWSYYLMLSSGVDIIKSTDILYNQSKNKTVRVKLKIFLDNIREGNSISSSVKNMGIDDDDIYYFVNLGEETGNIDQNLKVLSEMYSKKLNNDIKYIVQIMQPALIIFITVIVGGLMSGLILPMLDYSKFV